MIFVGALVKLLGNGRIAARGGRARRLELVLFGLTTLQQGMGGLAESLHPLDLPAVLGAPGAGWVFGAFGLRTLVVVGLVMTAVMQSSTASIAVTLSVYHAGAIGVDQGCAPIIGQNIGMATSSAMAAQAKRKGKILAKRNRPGRQNHNILAPPPAPSSGAKAQAVAIPFIVLPLPPRRAAVAGSRAYRKRRGATPLRGR